MPLTGSQSSYGKDQIKAAEWAVADINAKGGVNGKKLEMIVLDTQADPTIGISAVNRLINVDKVPVFVTAWSAVVKAVAPIANREKVLELSIGANAPEISKLGDYVYTAFPLADVDVTALANYTLQDAASTTRRDLYTRTTTPASRRRKCTVRLRESGRARSWPTRPTIRRRPTSPACCSR
jgi:branched-chain amino acid transport system substrate-binding protein